MKKSKDTPSAALPPMHLTDPVSGGDTGFYLPLGDLVVDRAWQTRRDRDAEVVAAIRASMEVRIAAGRHPQETPAWVVRRNTQFWLLAGFTRHELLTELAAGKSAYASKPTIWVTVKEAPTPYSAVVANMRENIAQRDVIRLAALHGDRAAQRTAFERLTSPEARKAEREAKGRRAEPASAPRAELGEVHARYVALVQAFEIEQDYLPAAYAHALRDVIAVLRGESLELILGKVRPRIGRMAKPRPSLRDRATSRRRARS